MADKMVERKGAGQEQEVDYEFFRAGVDGRKEGQQATDKRPAMIGGILGAGGVAYMAKQFKNRPKDMKISVYLIHTRMYAQMTVVGVLCCGMLNQMWKQYQSKAARNAVNHQ